MNKFKHYNQNELIDGIANIIIRSIMPALFLVFLYPKSDAAQWPL